MFMPCSARTTNQWEGKRIFFAFGTGMVLKQVSTSLSLTFQMIEGLSPSDRNKLLISLKNPFMDSCDSHFLWMECEHERSKKSEIRLTNGLTQVDISFGTQTSDGFILSGVRTTTSRISDR